MNQQELERALMRAKIAMMSAPDSAFLTTLCFSLKQIWDTEIERAATNGSEIRINPQTFYDYTPEERVFTLLEETLHVGLMHILESRIGNRNKDKWNRAADEAVRNILGARNFPIPRWANYDKKYANMSVEEIYDDLPDDDGNGGAGSMPQDQKDLLAPKPNGDGEGNGDKNGQGNGGGNDPFDGDGSADARMKKQIDDMLLNASTHSQMVGDKPGSIPGDIEFYLDKLLNPILPWHRILRKHLSVLKRNNYSYRKPNRRFLPEFYLPTLYSEDMGDVAVVVDTSASVSDEDFQKFVTETASIMKMLKPSKITFVQFDTKIRAVDELKKLSDIKKLKFTGRGGTIIEPVFDWIEQHQPKAVVVFTDGYFSIPQPPKVTSNFVWVIYDHPQFKNPNGKLIHYTL